jgi:pSer/pThr/pTyr-binding forkhead associated (FHA) protein
LAAAVSQRAPAAAPAAHAPGAASGVLVAVTGPLAGRRYPALERLTIGRGAQNTIDTGEDPSVSRQHCEVRREGGVLVVQDLGSSAGTWVNGRRLAAPHRLADNDLVRVGENTQFKFRVE